MTILSRLLALFPFLHAIGSFVPLALAISLAAFNPLLALAWFALSMFMLYLLPPLLLRVHNQFFPVIEGHSLLNRSTYSPWWGGHQIQGLFNAFPALEIILRVIPGAYSAWLRLWGAKIGSGVYWTPRVQIIDRPLLEVGDYTVWGHEAVACAHMINRKNDEIRLYTKAIRVGSNVLIGARSEFAPGVQIESGLSLKYATRGWVDENISSTSDIQDITKTRRDGNAK